MNDQNPERLGDDLFQDNLLEDQSFVFLGGARCDTTYGTAGTPTDTGTDRITDAPVV